LIYFYRQISDNSLVVKENTMSVEREYRVTRFSSVVGHGSCWRVINEVTGLEGEVVYSSYAAAKVGALEVGNHYRSVERRAGW
jgi:hypothetical protein